VSSYLTVSPLPLFETVGTEHGLDRWAVCLCGTFRGSPRLGVTQHPALWSPDFPRQTNHRGRPADSSTSKYTSATGPVECTSKLTIVRVVVLGGTRFIGRAVVEELVRGRHQLLVVHRGETELGDEPWHHLHVDRAALSERHHDLLAFRPDAAIDCFAHSRADARAALKAFPEGLQLVVLSSMDVYRAYASFRAGIQTDLVPLDEGSVLRTERYPHRGIDPDLYDYEKLDVEEEYLAAGATVLRLPMVYGEHDYQRREEFILRRVRAGRRRIPVGPGNWLPCLGYVREIARGVRLTLESRQAVGEVFNLAQVPTWTVRLWAEGILRAAKWGADLVRVPDETLPEDLRITRSASQHLLADSSKARDHLGWIHGNPEECLRTSTSWHLSNPPPQEDRDFLADDRALETTA
jgi:nucleoside-diphosphate-sugar epimerase